jgi:hypothetical protein
MRTSAKWASVGSAAIFSACFTTPASYAAIVLPSSADAEIREDDPENPRGAGAPASSGGQTELSIRDSGGQNRASIVRFDLTGLTAADVGGAVDLRFAVRANTFLNNDDGGVRIYGVSPTALNVGTWDEQTVTYRDAGGARPVVAGEHPTNQPAPGTPAAGDPTPPQFVTPAVTWGANPAAPTNAPGLIFENPPYVQAIEDANAAAYTGNQNVRAAYLADLNDDGVVQGTYAYTTYQNQPGYASEADPSYPLTTKLDADAAQTTLLGFLNWDAAAAATRPQGTFLSFAQSADLSNDNAANNAALIAFLTSVLDSGATSVTFLLDSKLSTDPAPFTGSNIQFATRDFIPTLGPGAGVQGAYAPQLILNVPEPTGAVAALGLLAASAGLRSRRSRRATNDPMERRR